MKFITFVKTMNESSGFLKSGDLVVVWHTGIVNIATILCHVMSFTQENAVDLPSVGRDP
jgi:hypothetical protein